MHELSIATEMLKIARDHAGEKTIIRLHLTIGPFSGIHDDSLRFCLEMLLKQDNASEAAIEITKEPAVFLCECGKKYEAKNALETCPSCNGFDRTILSGQDFRLDHIEVDDDGSN